MEQTFLAEVAVLALCAGFFFVALVAATIPVEGRKLPAILRAIRFVFRNERDPAYVGLATSVVVNKWSIRLYRVALGCFVLFLVAAG